MAALLPFRPAPGSFGRKGRSRRAARVATLLVLTLLLSSWPGHGGAGRALGPANGGGASEAPASSSVLSSSGAGDVGGLGASSPPTFPGADTPPAAPSGPSCPSAQVVVNGTLTATAPSAGVTDYWAASYTGGEAAMWVTGFEVTASATFDNGALSPGSGSALVELEFTPAPYAPLGGPGTSLLAPPTGVVVSSWELFVGGGNDGALQSASPSCLSESVPTADPYLTVFVAESSPTTADLVANVALTVDLVAPGGAKDCLTGQGVQYGGESDTSSGTPGTSAWTSSDPSALVGETVTGFEASLASAYNGSGLTESAAYATATALLLLTPTAGAAWNGAGGPATGFPAGALVLGAFEVAVPSTAGSGRVSLSVGCLDVVVPSTDPYLSLWLLSNTTTSAPLQIALETTTYLTASGILGTGCDAGGMPQAGGEADRLASGQAGTGWWAASDPLDLSGDYLNSFQVSLAENYAGAPQAGPAYGESLVWLFLSPVLYTPWNSGGQSIPSYPSGAVVLGAWILSSGSQGDHAASAAFVSCLNVVVPNGSPYLSLLIHTRGPAGLTSSVQSVTYGTVTTHSIGCSVQRNSTASLSQRDLVTGGGSTAWYAASSPASLAGDRVAGASLGISIAPDPGVTSLPENSSATAWLVTTTTAYSGNNGTGTALSSFPAGTVLAAIPLAIGSGSGSSAGTVSLSCLDVVLSPSAPYLTTVVEVVTGPAGALSVGVEAQVRAEPAADATSCPAPGSLPAGPVEAGGQEDTLPSASTGWWASSDPVNLSGRAVTSLEVSAALTFSSASASPAYGQALFSLFFASSPYGAWGTSGQALGSFPREVDPVGSWELRTGSGNSSAGVSDALTCLVVPVPVGAPYLSLLVELLSPSAPGLEGELQVAVGTATPMSLGSVVKSIPSQGDALTTSFLLTAAPVGGVPPYEEAWQLGDGSTAAGNAVNHTYLVPGSFTVEEWTNDSLGSSYASTLVLQVTLPPSGVASVLPAGPSDVGQSLSFRSNISGGAPPLAFLWKFGDGSGSIFQNTTHVFRTAGNYSVSFFANDSTGQSLTSVIPVTVYPDPVVHAGASPGTALSGAPVTFVGNATGGAPPLTWSWRFGDGGSSSSESPTHTFSAAGVFVASVFVNDSAGLTANSTVEVNVEAPLTDVLSFSSNLTRAGSATGVLVTSSPSGGSGTYRFSWLLNGTLLPSTSPSLRFAPAGAGNFSFDSTVTDGAGFLASASGVLALLPPLRVSLVAAPGNVVLGGDLHLSASVYAPEGPVTYTWSYLPPPCAGENLSKLSCTPSATGDYAVKVTVTDVHGDQASATVGITVVPPPAGPPSLLTSVPFLELVVGLGIVACVVAMGVLRSRRRRVERPSSGMETAMSPRASSSPPERVGSITSPTPAQGASLPGVPEPSKGSKALPPGDSKDPGTNP